jgi:threonine/homoserine/homoserine lactone efflux protein
VILLFLGATLLASLTPGPVVLLTLAVSVRAGFGPAVRAILGVCTGSTCYLLVSLAGLLAILVTHRVIFHAVQIAGATYLIYLGVRMVLGGARARGEARQETAAPPFDRPYFDGLVTQLSNPKAILYWTALLPPFIDPARPVPPQLLVLIAIGIGVDFVVLAAYAAGAAQVRRWLREPRFQRGINLSAGSLFVLTGAGLAWANLIAWSSSR